MKKVEKPTIRPGKISYGRDHVFEIIPEGHDTIFDLISNPRASYSLDKQWRIVYNKHTNIVTDYGKLFYSVEIGPTIQASYDMFYEEAKKREASSAPVIQKKEPSDIWKMISMCIVNMLAEGFSDEKIGESLGGMEESKVQRSKQTIANYLGMPNVEELMNYLKTNGSKSLMPKFALKK